MSKTTLNPIANIKELYTSQLVFFDLMGFDKFHTYTDGIWYIELGERWWHKRESMLCWMNVNWIIVVNSGNIVL